MVYTEITMATVNANPTVTTAPPVDAPKTKKRREKKSWHVVMTSGDGRVVKVSASRKGDGSGRTQVLHSTPIAGGKKRKNERGATQVHANIDAAKAQQEKLVDALKKRGWVVREPSPRGFQAKPDAFDINSLPVAAKPSKKK
jgi:hypothetical protein